ncbi:MAG: glycoside hydrolase family 15 protein [Chloroflexi bacterium]|nr:glycoside hydrolase family 15 protein [Chloroflexota bacterium]
MTHLHDASIRIIRAGQASGGGYVASPTFSQYGYSWLRDGTWIAYAMDVVGQHDSARRFYEWVGRTLSNYQAHVADLVAKLGRGETLLESDYLPTRFTLDGAQEADEWPNFQLDGYGTWLWGAVEHIRLTDAPDFWQKLRPAITLTVAYLNALWQSPNYDCWEEHRDQIHMSTLAAIYGGLKAVQQIEPMLVPNQLPHHIRTYALQHGIASEGHFMKYLGNAEVDANLLWTALPYGLVDIHDPIFTKTLAKIERDLHYPDGGVYRYRADVYYGGGEWLLLAAWLGWAYVELGRRSEAQQILHWIEAQAYPTGEMPEQVSEHLLAASHYPGWVERWGTSACPLLWSHAMYLILETLLKGTV